MNTEEQIIVTGINMTRGECDAMSCDNYLSQHHIVLCTHVDEETPKKGYFWWIHCCIHKRFRCWKKRSRRQPHTETVPQRETQHEEHAEVTAEVPMITAEVPTITEEVPIITAEVPPITAEARDSPLIEMKSETPDQGTNQTKKTKKHWHHHRKKNQV